MLGTEVEELRRKLDQQRAELIEAQAKRSGHWAKFEAERRVSARLRSERDALAHDFGALLAAQSQAAAGGPHESAGPSAARIRVLQTEIETLRRKLDQQQAALVEAQAKRSGHWAKFEAERRVSARLRSQRDAMADEYKALLTAQPMTVVAVLVQLWRVLRRRKARVVDADGRVARILARAAKAAEPATAASVQRVTVPVQAAAPVAAIPREAPPKKVANAFKVAVILDEFSYQSFRDEFDAIVLTPDNWQSQFEEHRPDLLLTESAWSGTDPVARPWKGKVYASERFTSENRTALLGILAHCGKAGIPTIFWNKEDPTHFADRAHDFVKTSRAFDHVFTTASECVDGYKRDRGSGHVGVLPFAVNPRTFNPVETTDRSDRIIFAGSWYAQHPARCREMDAIIGALADDGHAIDIYDRHYGVQDGNHRWPERYQAMLHPSIPHDQLRATYVSSRFGLNFNTVIDSQTMFARRVFELMACNTLVLSNYASGVDAFFGDLVVFPDRDRGRLKALDVDAIDALRERALTAVLREHTYRQRWQHVLESIGAPHLPVDRATTMVCCVASREDAAAAIACFQMNVRDLPGGRLLLVLDPGLGDTEVSRFYQDFNRHGVGVTSRHYAGLYAIDGAYRPIETPFAALVDPRRPPPAGWLARAMLHVDYATAHPIAPATGQRYRLSRAAAGQPLVGRASLIVPLLAPGAALPDIVYGI